MPGAFPFPLLLAAALLAAPTPAPAAPAGPGAAPVVAADLAARPVLLAQRTPVAPDSTKLNSSRSNAYRVPPAGPPVPGSSGLRGDVCEKCRRWCTSRCVPPGPGEKDCVCIRSEPN